MQSLKNKNRAEENQEKTQIKEKEQQNSDYELFKKLFKYFRDENVFYSFDKKDRYFKKLFNEKREEEKINENDNKSIGNSNADDKNMDREEEELEDDIKY